jgi:hypothetical protein
MIEFTITRTSTASIETVFDVMTDHRGLANTTWLFRRSTLDREGAPTPNGVGAIRRLTSMGTTFVEESVEYERPTRCEDRRHGPADTRDRQGRAQMPAHLGSGAPIRDHLGLKGAINAAEHRLDRDGRRRP